MLYNVDNLGIFREGIMKSNKKWKSLALKMVIALICGLFVGLGCIILRENLVSNGQVEKWNTINNLFFQLPCFQGTRFGFYSQKIEYQLLKY